MLLKKQGFHFGFFFPNCFTDIFSSFFSSLSAVYPVIIFPSPSPITYPKKFSKLDDEGGLRIFPVTDSNNNQGGTDRDPGTVLPSTKRKKRCLGLMLVNDYAACYVHQFYIRVAWTKKYWGKTFVSLASFCSAIIIGVNTRGESLTWRGSVFWSCKGISIPGHQFFPE